MNHGSLFSGIGGFDLAAEWMGWNNLFHCEWNPFGQKVLKHYWPEAESFNDITKTDFTQYANRISILTGGFPCQPYSSAGKRKGKDDERHLWPEMLRAIREIRPRWVVGENVLGLVNWSGGLVFHEVQADLEAQGYEVQPFLLAAASVGAPHKRERIFFIAYSYSNGLHKYKTGQKEQHTGKRRDALSKFNGNGCKGFFTNTEQQGLFGMHKTGDKNKLNGENSMLWGSSTGYNKKNNWQNFPTQPPVCGGNDGLPTELDGITFSKWRNESIKGYGNAIVPQVVFQIFKAIQEYENSLSLP